MRKLYVLLLLLCSCASEEKKDTFDFETRFEKSGGLETATYYETIGYYNALAEKFSVIHIQTIGETDSGKPLHLVTLNADANFDFKHIRNNKRVLLINNGIHPGESDGIDATDAIVSRYGRG